MSEARDNALAQLAAATSAEVMGTTMKIGATENIAAVRRSLSEEEAASFTADGLKVEGVRLTIDVGVLGYEPYVGGALVVDDVSFTVQRVQRIGANRRITMTRYMS